MYIYIYIHIDGYTHIHAQVLDRELVQLPGHGVYRLDVRVLAS